jgi:hypothetical protein
MNWLAEVGMVAWLLFLLAGIVVESLAHAWAIVIVCAAFLPVNSYQLGQMLSLRK